MDRKLTLLDLADRLGNVSLACRMMGYSRDSFYRFREIYRSGGSAALTATNRNKANVKNRVREEIELEVVECAREHPAWGQDRVAQTLTVRGFAISASGVRSVWQRYGLETSLKRRRFAEQHRRLELEVS